MVAGEETVSQPLIVALDGPSGVGKSTVARRVAEILEIPYLSTGAMYRALALKVLDLGIDPEDRTSVEGICEVVDLDLAVEGDRLVVLLDGSKIGPEAYSLEVSGVTSRISTYAGVRRRMVALQRAGALRQGAVLEGRDIGTRVFPDTPHKFFLEASAETRAERRWLQIRHSDGEGESVSRVEVLREVLERDERDSTREESPLTRDSSYILVQTDDLAAEQVVDIIVERVRLSNGMIRSDDTRSRRREGR
jgi:cytidylate kinase